MEKFDLALAGQRAYDLIWNEFCDWYIEIVKGRLYGDDEEDKKVARAVLVKVAEGHAPTAPPVHAVYHRRDLDISA